MINEAITKLINKEDITYEMAETVMKEIMSGEISEIKIGAYLIALAMKGETIDEITASATGMRNHGVKLNHNSDLMEIVGTGGDKSNSFNISTTTSLVVSAAGVEVAKHGNRAASSKCGAADVLEALGVNISLSEEQNKKVLDKLGICFLFAQRYHSAMKHVAPVRKELGVPTIFNILGPLTNPAAANMQLMGVFNESLVEPLAQVLSRLGVKKTMVVFGEDGLDEISISAPTKVCEIINGNKKSYRINPLDYGFKMCSKEDLKGGTPRENAKITLEILKGKKGPKRDAVVLNSAAALYIAKDNLTMKDAIKEAEEIIDSGKALKKLNDFIFLSNAV